MIDSRIRIFRNIMLVAAVLAIAIIFVPRLIQAYDSGAALLAPDTAARTSAATTTGAVDGDYSVIGFIAAGEPGEPDVKQAPPRDADAFFSDKLASGAGDTAAPNGVFTEDGTRLLAAAGYGDLYNISTLGYSSYGANGGNKYGAENGSGDGAGAAGGAPPDADKLPYMKQLAARISLYPDSPVSVLNTAIALSAPYGNIKYTGFFSSAAGSVMLAHELLKEDGGAMLAPLREYADTPRKPVYLTFDDGPSRLTPQVLDILRERKVRATFFVIGRSVQTYPDIVRDMYNDGHCIANHSYTHNYDSVYRSLSSLQSELQRCNNAINDVLGFEYNTKVFRFPGGSAYKTATKYRGEIGKLGYKYYDWNCLNGDAQVQPRDKSPNGLYNYMVSSYKGQDEVILLMHDSLSKQSTVNMLERTIDFFLDKGYEFRTLDEK